MTRLSLLLKMTPCKVQHIDDPKEDVRVDMLE